MPQRLSPSSAAAFTECEELFLYRYIWKLPEPKSAAMLRGTMVHETLEKLQRGLARTTESVHELFREVWRSSRTAEILEELFPRVSDERQWGLECLKILDNFLAMPERDHAILELESWVSARLFAPDGPKVVGKLDRLDCDSFGKLRIVDYKTSASAFDRDKAFFQLRCYALLLREERNLKVDAMRIVYLGGDTATVDDQQVTDLDATRDQLVEIWDQIATKVRSDDPTQFSHCSRPWCYCHKVRPHIDNAKAYLEARHHQDPPPSSSSSLELPATLKVAQLRGLCKHHNLDSVVPRGESSRDVLTQRLLDFGYVAPP